MRDWRLAAEAAAQAAADQRAQHGSDDPLVREFERLAEKWNRMSQQLEPPPAPPESLPRFAPRVPSAIPPLPDDPRYGN
jgi:hypothetical protein